MICPECEEEYRFEGFKFDWEHLRAFGSFRCGCSVKLVLPEEDCIRLGLLNPEAIEQLKHLRLMGFRLRLDREKSPSSVYLKALKVHKAVLVRYLAEVSGKKLIGRTTS